jgi:hypothetical protein
MGAVRTYLGLGAAAQDEEADERWRDVLFELVKQAKADPEFRARVEAAGAVIDDFEAVLRNCARREPATPCEAIACRDYWWGFQLEIPHAVLADWNARAATYEDVSASIGPSKSSTQFRNGAAAWIAARLGELLELDHGAGIHVSMTWMAPNILVAISVAAGSHARAT